MEKLKVVLELEGFEQLAEVRRRLKGLGLKLRLRKKGVSMLKDTGATQPARYGQLPPPPARHKNRL